MSENKLKFSGNYNDNSEDSLNYDDGDILNLNHKISPESSNIENDEKKEPDMSGLMDKSTDYQDVISSDITNKEEIKEDTDDLSYDLGNKLATESEGYNEEDSEAWKDAIKKELGEDIDEENDDNENIISDIMSDIGETDYQANEVDLDKDFGLKEEDDEVKELFHMEDNERNYQDLDTETYNETTDNNYIDEIDGQGDQYIDDSNYEEEIMGKKNIDQDVISKEVFNETRDMINQFKDKVSLNTDSEGNNISSSGNLEDFMYNMMRPMLKEWLDKNLPKLVKTIVQKEIKKILD